MPSKPPANVRTVNNTGPTSLGVKWETVPEEHAHGNITGYKIRYKVVEQGEEKIWSKANVINVPGNVNMVNITDLASYTRYEISVSAETKVGSGIWSSPVFGSKS